jgi:MFS family permease
VADGTVETTRKPAAASMWRNRDFRLVWLGATTSDFGSGITQIAYPLLVLAMTGSPVIAGLVSAARALPYLLFGLPAGALADRWNRKKVMIVCDSCRAVNMATIPLALWLGRLTAAQLVATAFIGGACFVFFDAADQTCLPNIVSAEQLTSAVSAQQMSSSAGTVAAPSLGGGLLTVFSGLPFIADGLSFLASAICMSAVRTEFRGQPPPEDRTRRLWSDIAEGLRWLWRHSAIRLIGVTACGLQMAISGASLIIIVSARHAGASSPEIGALFSAVGIGGVLGTLIAPRLKARLSTGTMLLAVMWMEAALWLLLGLATDLLAIAAVIVVFALTMPVFGVASLSYRLAVTPDHLRGRVGTAFSLLTWGAVPVGATASGMLLANFGPRAAALVFGGWVAMLSTIASLPGGLGKLDRRVAQEAARSEASA